MLIRDAIDLFFAIIGQQGANHAIWTKYILVLAQASLCHIWSYKWYDWTRQHWKDSFLTVEWETIKLVTSHPIKRVDKFYEWVMKPRDWVVYNPQSFCEECPWEWVVCVPCSCDSDPCKDLDIKYAHPQDLLCPWFYQVSGSEYQWMGWLGWSIIRVKLHKKVDNLWVTYYRDVPKIKKFDDKFPLPMQFFVPFAYYMSFIALWRYWQFRNWEEVTFLQIANQMLDDLKEKDNEAPKEMIIWMNNNKIPTVWFY
jgi:hypothetical protein